MTYKNLLYKTAVIFSAKKRLIFKLFSIYISIRINGVFMEFLIKIRIELCCERKTWQRH